MRLRRSASRATRSAAGSPGRRRPMCLGIPGRIVDIAASGDLADVEVEGVPRRINLALLEDEGLKPGDWILIHLGFALEKMNPDEAREARLARKEPGEPRRPTQPSPRRRPSLPAPSSTRLPSSPPPRWGSQTCTPAAAL